MMLAPLQKSKLKLLAFDIDGTIFSSEGIILDTYRLSIERFISDTGRKLTIPTVEEIMRQVGKPVKEIFRNLLPELEETGRESISNQVLSILCEKIHAGEGVFYPEAWEVLSLLRKGGYKLVTASNGRKPYIESILSQLKVLDFFEPIVVLDYEKRKHKGEILTHYLNEYKVKPDEILMIGDRDSDYQAAVFAGCPFLFCEYGHAENGEINDFSERISFLKDLPSLLDLL